MSGRSPFSDAAQVAVLLGQSPEYRRRLLDEAADSESLVGLSRSPVPRGDGLDEGLEMLDQGEERGRLQLQGVMHWTSRGELTLGATEVK